MIKEKLKSWEYYYNKLPLFFKNSHGISDHFKILFDTLVELDYTADDILKGFDIFAEDYADYIHKFENKNENNQYEFDLLDKLAEIYGITRYFDIKYYENDVLVKKSLKLTNTELHKLLLTRIVQANYNGTYEDARELYDKIGLPIYMINDTQSATVSLYLDYTKVNNENIIDMFKANLFTLNSLGITYLTSIRNVSELSTFDNENHLFDKGLWS